jgi:hypothetical protein
MLSCLCILHALVSLQILFMCASMLVHVRKPWFAYNPCESPPKKWQFLGMKETRELEIELIYVRAPSGCHLCSLSACHECHLGWLCFLCNKINYACVHAGSISPGWRTATAKHPTIPEIRALKRWQATACERAFMHEFLHTYKRMHTRDSCIKALASCGLWAFMCACIH